MKIEFELGTLFYQKATPPINDARVLLLFPGAGQDHTIFQRLVTSLPCTCYSFDLFFQGESVWNDPQRPIEHPEWKELILRFLQREKIGQFDVLGYSMGGRLALATLMAVPDQVGTLYMVAGEGLRENFWYSTATQRPAGKSLFKKITEAPGILLSGINVASRLKLISESTKNLAVTQLNSREKRQRLYGLWIVLSKLKITYEALAKISADFDIKLIFFFGTSDSIMSPMEARTIKKRIPRAQVEMVDASHHGLLRKLPGYLNNRNLEKGSL